MHAPAIRIFKEGRDVVRSKWFRGAFAGAVAILIANIVSGILFFQIGRGLILNPEIQSEKVIAVLTQIEPLPLMFTNGLLYLLVGLFIGVLDGIVFTFIQESLPEQVLQRGIAFGLILWVLRALYFEFHVPFNMFGEPVWLVGVELFFWIIVVLTEGMILALIYGKGVAPSASEQLSA